MFLFLQVAIHLGLCVYLNELGHKPDTKEYWFINAFVVLIIVVSKAGVN